MGELLSRFFGSGSQILRLSRYKRTVNYLAFKTIIGQAKKYIMTSVPAPAIPIVLVNSTISFSMSLSSQAVVLFDFILEKIKVVVLALTLKTAMTLSIDPALRNIMGKAKKAVSVIIMRDAKRCV